MLILRWIVSGALACVVPPVVSSAQAAATAAEAVLDDVALVGLVTSPDQARSSAVLRAAERTRVVGVGDPFFGARVVAIGAGHVTLEAGGRTRELRLSAAPQALPPAPAPAAVEADAVRVFTRAEVERRIADETPRLLSETALIPVTESGHVNGFVLSRVPEGSLLTDLGLRAGDVLTEINGTAIDSMATLLALYARLRNESEIRATVLRGGSPVPLAVRLR
jgi:type II secretion system protein C